MSTITSQPKNASDFAAIRDASKTGVKHLELVVVKLSIGDSHLVGSYTQKQLPLHLLKCKNRGLNEKTDVSKTLVRDRCRACYRLMISF